MNLTTFKKIANQINALEKTGLKFDISIENDRHWETNCSSAEFRPIHYTIGSLAQLASVKAFLPRFTLSSVIESGSELAKNPPKTCVAEVAALIKSTNDLQVIRRKYPSIKHYAPGMAAKIRLDLMLISEAPTEAVHDDVTYRYVGTSTTCHMCVPHTDPIYIYLDKGFTYLDIAAQVSSKSKYIITNELTPDTYLCMLLCKVNPGFAKHLELECFINFNKAKLTRLRMEKELTEELRRYYQPMRDFVLDDYDKVINSNLITKVVRGELPTATFNQIRLTKDSATYEFVSVREEGILEKLTEVMVFDDRTDIYNIANSYIDMKIQALEGIEIPELADGAEPTVHTTTLNINGINIRVSRTNANSRRKVNDQYINRDELLEVCYRATCLQDQETFDKFVKSVKDMSLKWHDAIGNGLPVKIHDGLTAIEYMEAAPTTCPRLRFVKEKGEVLLVTGEGKDDKVPIKLNQLMTKLAGLNRKINNKYVELSYSPRNAAWGRRQLKKLLQACCTFDTKIPLKTEDGKPLVIDGKRRYRVERKCLLTEEKAAFIGQMAIEYYQKAIERSGIFLAEAVKRTGATTVHFQGSDCWYVEGVLHKYAVCKKTNRVFNFESGRNICIVEPGHRVEVGFDATASRLLALKNDAYRVQQIGTLRAG